MAMPMRGHMRRSCRYSKGNSIMKYYVHRTSAVMLIEVNEVEADSVKEAIERVDEGEGNYLGLSVGDYIDSIDESCKALPAEPQNIPLPFYPVNSIILNCETD